MFDARVIIKYALIHLVELALISCVLFMVGFYMDISTWIVISVIILLILKDIVMFPKVWTAYEIHDRSSLHAMIGMKTVVVHTLDPAGYVKARGELWKAEVSDPLLPVKKGDSTRVIDIKGRTLVVERCNGGPESIG